MGRTLSTWTTITISVAISVAVNILVTLVLLRSLGDKMLSGMEGMAKPLRDAINAMSASVTVLQSFVEELGEITKEKKDDRSDS